MNTMTSTEISDEQAVLFFTELKCKLNLPSVQKTVSLVRVILSKLSGSYSQQKVTEIVSKTPSLFHLLLVNPAEIEKNEIGHLDELVDTLYQEDQSKGNGLFKSEIEALSFVTVVLRKLEKFLQRAGIYAFNYTLAHELQQAVQEEGV